MKELIAEFLGTFTLVFAITAAVGTSLALTTNFTAFNWLGVSLTAGFVLTALVYAFGGVSGGHFNPAVTIGLWAAKRFPMQQVPGYLAAQFAGALVASGMLWFLVGRADLLGATTAGMFGVVPAIVFEGIATALFVLVILGATDKKALAPGQAGIAIGGFLLVAHLMGLLISGSSLNPARSFGPAILAGGQAMGQLWIYFVGPILGAVVGGFIYRYGFEAQVKAGQEKPKDSKEA